MLAAKTASASPTRPVFVEEDAELGLHSRPLAGVGDSELERGREPCGRFVVCHRRACGFGGAEVVVDCAFDARERGGEGEVVGELGQDAAGVG